MGLYIILFGILAGLSCVAAILIYRRKLFQHIYACEDGDFVVKGRKEKFVVSKDGRFEFAIVDGQIVSVKDKMVSSQLVRYGGETNE